MGTTKFGVKRERVVVTTSISHQSTFFNRVIHSIVVSLHMEMGQCEKNELLTSLVLRITAYDLPCRGIRMLLPDTFAVVSSVAGPNHANGKFDSEEHVIGRTET